MKLISSTLFVTLLASTTFSLAENAIQQTKDTAFERIEVAQSAAADEIKKKAMMLAEDAKKAMMMAEEAEKKAMMAAEGEDKKKAMMMAEETKKKAMMAAEEAKKAEMMAAEEDKKAMMMAEEEKKKAMMMAAEEAKKKEMMAAEEDKKAMMMAVEACDAAEFAVTGFGNATAAADSIADVVMKVKELSGDAACAIEITGYSSKAGPKSVNMALSEERAEWVKGELMSAGVDLSHTMVKGAGETGQFGSSSANRRVMISVK
ncbi:OmpA family protein [Lentilitoribacter sp. Alg239-R112]|uniref:OmpA family protein n=1 Tax=Lentilitoribacter sp. Alg239-R112 TaxID=2305987 RepID=UPI0013A6BB8B|nr:OmpA family protein [Lentilitoribacter sp. Alg239-R112]